MALTAQRRRRYMLMVERAWAGAQLSASRVRSAINAAPASQVIGLEDWPDMSSDAGHDVDYYTFEIARIIEIADDMVDKRGSTGLISALGGIDLVAPQLRSFRNAITHPMDRPLSSAVAYEGAALLFAPTGEAEILLDPFDYDLNLALHELVAVLRRELAG